MKKYFKYILTIFALFFVSTLSVRASYVCTYGYDYRGATLKLSVSVDDTGRATSFAVVDANTGAGLTSGAGYGKTVSVGDGYVSSGIEYIQVDKEVKELLEKSYNNSNPCPELAGYINECDQHLKIIGAVNTKVGDDCSRYISMKGTSNKSESKTTDEADPILENTIKHRSASSKGKSVSMMFAKRKSGKYHYEISVNGGTAVTGDVGSRQLITVKGNDQIIYKISTGDFADFWSKPEGTQVYLNPHVDGIVYISFEEDINDTLDKQAAASGSITYTVTGIDDETKKPIYMPIGSLCTDSKVKSVFRLLGYVLFVTKILIPLGLIIFGIITFVNVLLSGDQEVLKKKAINFALKIVAAIAIFFLPTVIYLIVGLADGVDEAEGIYVDCKTCIFDPGGCK